MIGNIDPLLRAATVRKVLDVPERTFRRWIACGRFPRPDKCVGRSMRWRKSTVEAWMESRP